MYKKFLVLFVATILGMTACESNESDGDKASAEAQKASASAQEGSEEKAADEKSGAQKEGESQDDAVDEPKSDQSFAGLSDQENFYVEITPAPNPIPFQELFVLEIRVLDPDDEETPLQGVQLDQVRATMPAHNHGMKVEPKVKETADGEFTVEGMKFHMQGPGKHGRWVIEAVLNDGETVDKVSYDVQCCAE